MHVLTCAGQSEGTDRERNGVQTCCAQRKKCLKARADPIELSGSTIEKYAKTMHVDRCLLDHQEHHLVILKLALEELLLFYLMPGCEGSATARSKNSISNLSLLKPCQVIPKLDFHDCTDPIVLHSLDSFWKSLY